MKRYKTVDDYMEGHGDWRAELVFLRSILNESGLEETVKWGAPAYTVNGKNVVGIAAFKNHVALWFHQGALIKDEHGVLINAQEGTTKALRQWRFTAVNEMDADLIKTYVQQAILNEQQGLRVQPAKKKEVNMPEELETAFTADASLKSAFDQFSPYKQREFIEHLTSAKRADTRQRRLEKILPMIRDGIGLHDAYR